MKKPWTVILYVMLVILVLFKLGFSPASVKEIFTPSEEMKQRMPFMAGMLDRTAETGQKDLEYLFGVKPNVYDENDTMGD